MTTLAFDDLLKATTFFNQCLEEGVHATSPRWVDPTPHPAGGWIRGGWAVSFSR